MPSQAGFTIKQNTPEADKLERRLHEQLKEIWDPAADATVARYLTAMLAKGYDRKKIHSQLKAILQESVSVQLLDWLYKHLRLHGNEYQNKEPPASSKPVPKPPVHSSKTPQAIEEELRLEDLEAQQLEGSDLDDDELSEPPKPNNRTDAAAAGPAAGDRAQDRARDSRGGAGQEGGQGDVAQRAVAQRPAEKPETVLAASHAAQQKPDAALSAGPQAAAAAERRERRQREPIPVPNFTEPARAGPSKAAAPDGTQTAPEPPSPTAQPATAGDTTQPATDGKTGTDADRQTSPPGDRRRLKSSIVLDWESWQRERQPSAGRSWDWDKGEETGPEGKQSGAPGAEPPKSSDRPQPMAGKADRERDRDRGGGASGRREGGFESRHTHRDGGNTAMRRGHERDGGSDAAGGSKRRSGDRDMGTAAPQTLAPRSRSRSRSRSPRGGGRRSARGAPVAAPANLLRTALRGVDAVKPAGGPPSAPRSIAQQPHAAAGSAEAAAKPSVFARLGAGTGEAPADGLGRSARSQRAAGAHKVMDVPAAGRKRGLTGSHGAHGADDSHLLGSPPKAARGAPTPKPHPGTPLATQVAGNQVATAAASGLAAPGAVRQRGSGLTQGARAPIVLPVQQPQPAVTAAGGKDSKIESAATAAETDGVRVDELEALRQQMAAMQEQIARMEAEKRQAQQVPPAAVAAAERPQQQQHLPAGDSGRLPAPGPTSSNAGAAGTGVGGPSAMRGGLPPLEMSDVIIEGGRGSPPPRKASGPLRPGVEAAPGPGSGVRPARMSAAQLDAEMRSVVVENVHFLAHEQVVAAHFSVVGPVRKVTILRDGFTGRPSGMAVVEMATEAATQAAATLSGSLLMNLAIVVTLKAALLLQEMGVGPMPMDVSTIAGTVRGEGNLAAVLDGPGSLGMPGTRLNPAAAPFVPAALAGGSGLGRAPLMGAVGGVRQGAGPMAGVGRPPWPGRGGRGRFGNVWVREAAETGIANEAGAEKVA